LTLLLMAVAPLLAADEPGPGHVEPLPVEVRPGDAAAEMSGAYKDAEALLDAIAERRGPVASLKARFIMDNTTPAEKRRTEGELLYVAPRRLVFRLFDRDGALTTAYLFDDETIYEYDVELEQMQRTSEVASADIEALFAAFESDPDQVGALYETSLFDPGDTSARAAHGLLLRPKPREDGQPLFERVRIYLTGDSLLPVKLHVINSAESEVMIVFGPFDVNGPVTPEETQLALPEGTMVIEEGEPVGEVEGAVRRVPEAATPRSETAAAPEAAAG
jgi:outer membrane lipoprotein-sorting protein